MDKINVAKMLKGYQITTNTTKINQFNSEKEMCIVHNMRMIKKYEYNWIKGGGNCS